MENLTYIYSYDLKDLKKEKINKIKSNVLEKIISLKKSNFKENLNNTNKKLWDNSCIFWYVSEELLSVLDKSMQLKWKESWESYDFIKDNNWQYLYVDVKSVKTEKSIEEIIKKKYKIYLQAYQVKKAEKFCIENNIKTSDFYFQIIYWWWHQNFKYYRAISNDLRLDNILNMETVKKNPAQTHWAKYQIENYELSLFSKETIILNKIV